LFSGDLPARCRRSARHRRLSCAVSTPHSEGTSHVHRHRFSHRGASAVAYHGVRRRVRLVVFGRLSDHLGRRRVGAGALTSSALGLVILLGVDGLAPLATGRALQGLATGLASSALGAFVVDSAPEHPAGAGRPVLAMAGLILATWSLGGFYQAFGPSIALQQLHSQASLTAGAVFGSFTVLAPLGGPLTARLRPDRAMRLGALAYPVCVVGILVTLGAAVIGPFLAVSLLAGVTQGVAQTGGMRSLLGGIGPADRAGLLATVFLLNYSSAAVPSLIAGRLTTTFSLVQIAAGYAVLVLIGVLVVLLLARPAPSQPHAAEPTAQHPQ
jgi:MFS family permease